MAATSGIGSTASNGGAFRTTSFTGVPRLQEESPRYLSIPARKRAFSPVTAESEQAAASAQNLIPEWNQGAAKRLSRDKSITFPVGADVTRILAASHQRLLSIPNLPETAPNDPTGPRFLVEDIFPSVDG